jgi:outer membrane protein assembly factor BamB
MPEIRYPHVAVPLVTSNQHVVISSGYGKGSMKIRAELQPDGKWLAAEEWKTNRMKAKFSNLVEHQGHIYGLDDGTFACLDHEKGELKWRDGRFGHGQIIFIEPGLILVMAENGNVVLVEATPEALQEVARFVALEDKTWNPPALAGEYLVVRNDKEAACYRLPISAKPSSP